MQVIKESIESANIYIYTHTVTDFDWFDIYLRIVDPIFSSFTIYIDRLTSFVSLFLIFPRNDYFRMVKSVQTNSNKLYKKPV